MRGGGGASPLTTASAAHAGCQHALFRNRTPHSSIRYLIVILVTPVDEAPCAQRQLVVQLVQIYPDSQYKCTAIPQAGTGTATAIRLGP
eukprot:346406-Rhodomonas_salina.1